MPRGGKRAGAGRPKGSRSAANKEQIANISELARMHTSVALSALVHVASKGESESARVSAASALLDRAWGKPQQALELTGKDGGPIQTVDATKLSDAALLELHQAMTSDQEDDGAASVH